MTNYPEADKHFRRTVLAGTASCEHVLMRNWGIRFPCSLLDLDISGQRSFDLK